MADEEKNPRRQGGEATYALESYLPEGLVAHFSNNFHIVSTDQEVYLSFLQPEISPVNVDSSPGGEVHTIRNKCVARIILTPNGRDVLIDLLTRNRDRKPRNAKVEGE